MIEVVFPTQGNRKVSFIRGIVFIVKLGNENSVRGQDHCLLHVWGCISTKRNLSKDVFDDVRVSDNENVAVDLNFPVKLQNLVPLVRVRIRGLRSGFPKQGTKRGEEVTCFLVRETISQSSVQVGV